MRARLLAGALALLGALPAHVVAAELERHAIVVGNNEGAADRARLWFAERDAQRLARALEEMGGFSPDKVTLLRGQGAEAVREAVARVETQISASPHRDRSLLLVYYSGHAGAKSLELGADRISFDELRRIASTSSAAVKVVMVDACHSGALTQVKGAKGLASLDFALPAFDDAVRGVAYVASTAVGEAAQESAALEGSFFSHHLEAALRGAADSDGDGAVTLIEAFRYTSGRTVVGTTGTVSGAQHPTFDVKMSGRGDIVLADLRRAEARLLIPPDPAARYLVRGSKGLLVELEGSARTVTLGLPADRYEIQRREGVHRTGAQVELLAGESRPLPALGALGLEQSARKGGSETTTLELLAGPSTSSGVLPNAGWGLGGRLGVGWDLGWTRLQVRADVAQRSVADGVLRYRLRELGGAAAAMRGWHFGRILLEVGPEMGGAWTTQTTPFDESWSAPVWRLGMTSMLSLGFGPARVGLEAGAGAFLLPLDGRWTVRPGASAGIMVGYAL